MSQQRMREATIPAAPNSTGPVMKVRRVDFFFEEFHGGVSQLDCNERGALITLLCLIYARGGPIPDDDAWLARECAMSKRMWRITKERLIAAGKLIPVPPAFLTNARAEF